MKKLLMLALIGIVAWKVFESGRPTDPPSSEPLASTSPVLEVIESTTQNFQCDGRIYCSQMRSCDEATYFLKHCPGVKMDGNNDGIPCEKQWCQ